MGGLSAVGICQMALHRLSMLPIPYAEGLPSSWEVRKDHTVPINWKGRVLRFFQDYTDRWDGGSGEQSRSPCLCR